MLRNICLLLFVICSSIFITYEAIANVGQARQENLEEAMDDASAIGYYFGVVESCGSIMGIKTNEAVMNTFFEKYFTYKIKKGADRKELAAELDKNLKIGRKSIIEDRFFALCWRTAANLEEAYSFFGLHDPRINKIGEAQYPME